MSSDLSPVPQSALSPDPMRYEIATAIHPSRFIRRYGLAILAAGGLALASAVPASHAGANQAPAGELAFIANSGDATVSVIDIASRKELKRVPMLREPDHLGPTPDGKELVVADDSGNTMFFLD